MTPPISPTGANGSSADIISEKGECGFHCIGEACDSFDPRGFVMSRDGQTYNPRLKQNFVNVFNTEYDIANGNQEDLNRLFRISCKRISLFDTKKTPTFGNHPFNNLSASATVDLHAVRQELREFFVFLRFFVSLHGDEDSLWVVEETLPALIKGLTLIRTQLGFLTDLPSYVFAHSHVKNGFKSDAFHLLHLHLELRWLQLSVLWTLSSVLNSQSKFLTAQDAVIVRYGSESSIQNLLQSTIKLCLVDLIEVAVFKFHKLSQEMIVQSSLFNCMCFKELWFLLRVITENLYDNDPKSFWNLVDDSLELVVKAGPEVKKAWRPLKAPSKISCLEPDLFALWMLQHIGQLYLYNESGYKHLVVPELKGGEGIVKRVMNNLIGSEDVDEPKRRTLISLIRAFMSEPWRPRPEPLMMLWEGFSRKLDCAFQLPGAHASSFVVASDTVDDILASVDFDGCSNKPQRKLNSFEMFLSLLVNYVKEDATIWKSKMCGRFYSKLSEKKVDGLSQMGLYHLTQLFVAIARQTDVEEVGQRFCRLVRFSETDERRNEIVMKAHLCFFSLYLNNGKSLSPFVDPVTKTVSSLIVSNQNPVVQVFIDNLNCIIRNTKGLPPDLYVVFGDWVKCFLSQNLQDSTALRNLLNIMINVMEKIQTAVLHKTVGVGVEKLVSRLYENLLPYLKDQKCNDWEQIADLAVHFTFLSLEFNSTFSKKDSFQSLVHHFMMVDSHNVMLVRRYFHRILSCDRINHILDANESLQVVFFQAWVRTCLLTSNVDLERDQKVAQKILMMPLLNSFNIPMNISNSDPLIFLIESLGNSSSSKEAFPMLVEALKQFVPLIKSTLFPSKSKDSAWVPEKNLRLEKDVIVGAFLVFGNLTLYGGAHIYEKNTASNFLITIVTNLILLPNCYDMDVRIPLSMEEGLRKSLLFFLRGLIKLEPKKQMCLQRFVNDIVKVYVPRFSVNPHNDPFTKIFDEPEYISEATYIIQTVCKTLLQVDGGQPYKYYVQGLQLVDHLVKRNACDDIVLGILIENVLPACLYVIAKVTNMNASNRRPETERTLQAIFEAEAYCANPHLWEQTNNVLNQLSIKYLGFQAQLFMRMLVFLVKVFKPCVKGFLPNLESNIKEVISKRGVGTDKNLESLLAALKGELNKET